MEHRIWRIVQDPNYLAIHLDFPSEAYGEAFAADPALKEAMDRAGVTAEPGVGKLAMIERKIYAEAPVAELVGAGRVRLQPHPGLRPLQVPPPEGRHAGRRGDEPEPDQPRRRRPVRVGGGRGRDVAGSATCPAASRPSRRSRRSLDEERPDHEPVGDARSPPRGQSPKASAPMPSTNTAGRRDVEPGLDESPKPTSACWVAAPTQAATPVRTLAATTSPTPDASRTASHRHRATGRTSRLSRWPAASSLRMAAIWPATAIGHQPGGDDEHEAEVGDGPGAVAAEPGDHPLERRRALQRLAGRLGDEAEDEAGDGQGAEPAIGDGAREAHGQSGLAAEQAQCAAGASRLGEGARPEVPPRRDPERDAHEQRHERPATSSSRRTGRDPVSGRSSSIQPSGLAQRSQPSAGSASAAIRIR